VNGPIGIQENSRSAFSNYYAKKPKTFIAVIGSCHADGLSTSPKSPENGWRV